MAADAMGIDLVVVPTFIAHDAAEVDLSRRPTGARVLAISGADESYDLAVVGGRENLAQALLLRLLTPQGSLAALGHGGYGSRLHTLIGRNKTDALRNLCRAFVLEAVAQEPRVEDSAVALSFDPAAETASSFVFTLEVKPRAGGAPLGLSLEVAL